MPQRQNPLSYDCVLVRANPQVQFTGGEGGGGTPRDEGEALVRRLQATRLGIDEKLGRSRIQLFEVLFLRRLNRSVLRISFWELLSSVRLSGLQNGAVRDGCCLWADAVLRVWAVKAGSSSEADEFDCKLRKC